MGEQNGTRVLLLVTLLLLILSSVSASLKSTNNNNNDDDSDNDNIVRDKDQENKDRQYDDLNNDDGEGSGQEGECRSSGQHMPDEHADEIDYPLPTLLFLFLEHKTLEDVYATVLKPMMPNQGTQGYFPPSPTIIEDYGRIVLDMMRIDGSQSLSLCGQIDLRSLVGKYRMGLFIDQDNGRTYCLFVTTPIKYPWGNVIVDVGVHQRKVDKKIIV